MNINKKTINIILIAAIAFMFFMLFMNHSSLTNCNAKASPLPQEIDIKKINSNQENYTNIAYKQHKTQHYSPIETESRKPHEDNFNNIHNMAVDNIATQDNNFLNMEPSYTNEIYNNEQPSQGRNNISYQTNISFNGIHDYEPLDTMNYAAF
jgi:hypothetical protein